MARFIIDRFEGEDAFLEDEDRTILLVQRRLLPKASKEGDVLRLNQKGVFKLDPQATCERKESVNSLFERLTGKKPT